MFPEISRRSSPSTVNFSIASRSAVSSCADKSFAVLPASIDRDSSVVSARGRPTPYTAVRAISSRFSSGIVIPAIRMLILVILVMGLKLISLVAACALDLNR